MLEVPVKPSFFPPLSLSAQDIGAYRHAARHALEQLQQCINTFSWKRVESREGLLAGKVHCIEQDNFAGRLDKSAACLVLRGTTTVRGTISEILDIIASSNKENYRRSMHRLYPKRFVDGLTLHTIDCNAQESLNVKWAAFKDDHGVGGNIDYCFLEYAGIQDSVGFCVFYSIERPREVPPLSTFGYRREVFRRTGFLINSCTQTGMVQITMVQQSSPSSNVSIEKFEQILYQRQLCLTQIGGLISQQRLSRLPIIDRTLWIADNQRKFCAVCLKSFNFHRKHHCRVCGEVVCGSCANYHAMDVPILGLHLVRVCTFCIAKANAIAISASNQALPELPKRRQSIVLLDDIQLRQPEPSENLPERRESINSELPMRAMLEDLYPQQKPRPKLLDSFGSAARPPLVPVEELMARISSIKQSIADISSARAAKEPEQPEIQLTKDDAGLSSSYNNIDNLCSPAFVYPRPSLISARTSLLSMLSLSPSSSSSGEDVEMLRHQVSELHRLLEQANSRLDMYQQQQVERQIKYCESQSGNASNDPVLVKRRQTYQAMLSELHDIMGISSRLD